MRRFILPTIALAAAFASAPSPADAQTQRVYRERVPEITVTRRSYLDPGKVVPVGRDLNYVYLGQGPLATPPYSNMRSFYGQETLPQRFDLPGCCGVTVDFVAPGGLR